MNLKIIIPCAIICMATGLVFFNAEVGEQVSAVAEIATETKQVVIPQTYDCAKEYDKLMSNTLQLQAGHQTANPYKEALSAYNGLTEGFVELVEYRCFITIESWAHESQYEAYLWNTDWKQMSWINQVVLNEADCNTKECDRIRDAFTDNTRGLN